MSQHSQTPTTPQTELDLGDFIHLLTDEQLEECANPYCGVCRGAGLIVETNSHPFGSTFAIEQLVSYCDCYDYEKLDSLIREALGLTATDDEEE